MADACTTSPAKSHFLITYTVRDGNVEYPCRYTAESATEPTDRQLIADIVPYELDWRGEPDGEDYKTRLDELEAHYTLHREIHVREGEELVYDIRCQELTASEAVVLKKFGI